MREILANTLTCGIIAVFLGLFIKEPSRRLLDAGGLVRHNYAGKLIPTSAGVIFITTAFCAVMITVTRDGTTDANVRMSFSCLLLIVGSSLAGLIDDVHGSHSSKGLTGHMKTFMKDKKITTGIQKAVAIWLLAAVSVTLSEDAHSLFTLVFNATLISLAANFMNLLDLRPGRSAKAFFIVLALLIAYDFRSPAALVPVGLAGAVLAGLSDELSEKWMMGDAGANPLGAALGYWISISLSLSAKAVVLLSLICAHISSERCSFSKIIDKNPVLRFIDRLGRSQLP